MCKLISLLFLLIPLLLIQLTSSQTNNNDLNLGFRCNNPSSSSSSSSTTTCTSLIDYMLPYTVTLSSLLNLFQIENRLTFLSANNLPLTTSLNQTYPSTSILKIPFPCSCANGIGISDHRPLYPIAAGDALYHTAAEVFSNMVTYQQIVQVNNLSDVNLIDVGEMVWIPLPCSCDDVDGDDVVHYGYRVADGITVAGIAQQFNTTEATLLELNGMANAADDLKSDSILDVPLQVCTSMVRNNSLDYPLLVPKGTYTFTANNCVRCQCNAANNWILECEPSGIMLPNNQTCPSMQCVGTSFYLGNTTLNSDCNRTRCAYFGCTNNTIFANLTQESICPGTKKNWRLKLFIGSLTGALSIVLIIIMCCLMKSSQRNCIHSLKPKTEEYKSVEAFITQYGTLGTKRYKYVDIKKMTNSFKVKLGKGGFGTVFKGKLSDGRLVAVKVLNSSKASGQEFINEVASIGRTSHVNIVTLLGFCFDYEKRALVYEFMPNGSLEKYIHSDHVPSKTTSEHIGVEGLYRIAFGVAQGLDYLHRGCNTRILHLDIKPHNILLDEDFCPKIADFGLAKLYSRKESMVSMLEARGTIGYIAPEVFNRNFGGVSHKSDVSSYGMLILEMVGGRKNVDAGVGSGRTSEIYFPYWIYSRLEKEGYLLEDISTAEENDYARKMTIVGLWCIQTDPTQRPSIGQVIEMLEGSMETLEVPPKPFFSSPLRLPTTTFSTSQDEPEISVVED
ncbi:LEAF RUST 10 DISEASE-RESISTANCEUS RECEPTOR-LIKE PROTEIN KINASE-like 2.5 isoform X2 [Rutidosis leptorrhynchoides]|uniref:LEAF RUST 10 DISEASE-RESISTANCEUS RECEPTOR-LIKE PROTEIN KINASE-like 2.5 isoform X2 n=1 Tax=Rutidosis leptorrhynchoides TaxID=125765 RepID=UPI003A9A2504